MYYITVSNGLLTPEHKRRMGSAVWEFMWCLDKVTQIDSKGKGKVLGGKPVKLNEIGMGHDNTTSRNIQKLVDEEYIETLRTPYGMVIHVLKVKKRFNKNSDSQESVIHQKMESPTNNGGSPTNNGGYKEDNTVDSTDDNTNAPTSGAKSKTTFNPLGAEIIKSFEEIDIKNKRNYGNKTQRSACDFLIENYGLEKVLDLIPKLKETNRTTFYQITTPQEMVEKITKVFNDVQRKRVEVKSKGRGIA